jgi:Ca2+:H+ antiporter
MSAPAASGTTDIEDGQRATWIWSLALISIPIAYGADRLLARPLVTFALAGAAIIPLAEWMRRATEQLTARAGSAIGGLLNVTFGNAAELILALFVLSAGHADVVKAQITGAIIGNSLLGLGAAIVAGTWRRPNLKFKRARAGQLSSLLMLATIALLVPALFDYTERGIFASDAASVLDEHLSLGVAVVLIVVYFANLAYTLYTHRDVFAFEEHPHHGEPWPLWQSIAVLLGATVATALMSELVSGALEATADTLGVTTFFLGIIALALIGNAAEYLSAVYFARQGRMGLALSLTVGSTIQVALLVAPVLVLVSWVMGKPMNLVFDNPLELIAIAAAAFIVHDISSDGETTWFEGVLLIGVYCVLGLAFFFVDAP